MTEDQARKKWCPMIRLSPLGLGTGESYGECTTRDLEDKYRSCIASECMMWRRHPEQERFLPMGYCGLARKEVCR
jgi:hypothetical protein